MPPVNQKLSLFFSAKSDIGLVRTENQDSFGKFPEDNTNLYSAKGQLFIVADGMGGHKGGKEASSIAVKVVNQEYFKSSFEESVAIKEAIEAANIAIYNKSGSTSEFSRMGTTCTVLLLKDEKGIIGHVGDSRIYKIENGGIEQLTNDHTKVSEMLAQGILTPEEARNYPSKSVLARALGVDDKVRVDIDDLTLKKGQSFVMCSDGLAKVSKGEILTIVSNNSPSDACQKLVDLANERGGKDNVTVLILKINPEQAVKIPAEKPIKRAPRKKKSRRIRKGWLGLIIIIIIMLLVVYQYGNSIVSVFSGEENINPPKETTVSVDQKNPKVKDDVSDNELLSMADNYFLHREYEKALSLYNSILDKEPMHQAALKGVNEISSIFLTKADNLMNAKQFKEALDYYKKVEAIQPGNEKVKSLIRLCVNQIDYEETPPGLSENENPPESKTVPGGSQLTTTRFDIPGWNYPGTNKNEFSIKSYELSFTKTLSEKFIIYRADLFDVTISVNAIIDNPASSFGLIIGYVSPSDYYIFKYSSKGDYLLLRIKENDVEKLLVVPHRGSGTQESKTLKIQYSDNLISIYDENGLLSSYKSVWGIFGKPGLYVDRNSSVTFRNILLTGKTKLD